MTFPLQFLIAALATVSFAVLFNARKIDLIFCGITGGFGWIIYYVIVLLGGGVVVGSFVASFCLTILARIFATRKRNPVTIYLLTGIFPLVPGAGLYYTAYYFFTRNNSMLSMKGSETIEIALAIVFGIIFGFGISQKLFTKLFGTNKIRKCEK